jgi:RNA polymerase sigma-70 factor (ECF subfamily)
LLIGAGPGLKISWIPSQRFPIRERFLFGSMQATALIFEMARVAEDAFDQVVRHREAQLLRIAYRVLGNWADAEDVTQEVFLRLHRHGLDFANEGALGAWLYRVTVNLCVDKSRRARPTMELPELGSGNPSAEAELLRDERKRRLMMALSTLPAKERAVVVMREIEGLSTMDVAKILGSSEGTVRGQVSKAMGRLREQLNKEKGEKP